MIRITFLFILTTFLSCVIQKSTAQVIFNETFGQTTTRQTTPYMPAGSYTWGNPAGTSDERQIENNYYAVIAPANIRDAWPVPAWWFWTGAEPVGNTWGGANNASTPNGNTDHTGNLNGAVLAVNAGTTLHSFYRRQATLVAGNSYRLSAWFYLVNPSSMISMRILDPQDNDILGSNVSAYYSTTGSWQQLVYEFTFPSSCASAGKDVVVNMANALSNNSGNDYYIDDIILETIPFTGTNVITCPDVLLDLKRIDLTAAANTDGATVAWAVDDESDVQYYEVQKSTNGASFEAIYKETVTTPNLRKNYKYSDVWSKQTAIATSRTYYRINAVKQNGKTHLSNIVSISAGKNNSGLAIYPQPASNKGIVNITWINAATMNIRILGLSGGVIKVINNARGGNVQINDLASGMYVVELTNISSHTVACRKLQVL